eukprot:365023-Chlamydomonas_euryale.AAC.29
MMHGLFWCGAHMAGQHALRLGPFFAPPPPRFHSLHMLACIGDTSLGATPLAGPAAHLGSCSHLPRHCFHLTFPGRHRLLAVARRAQGGRLQKGGRPAPHLAHQACRRGRCQARLGLLLGGQEHASQGPAGVWGMKGSCSGMGTLATLACECTAKHDWVYCLTCRPKNCRWV